MDVALIKPWGNWFLLALTMWREARGESKECKVAVAWSILNRVARGGWWGDRVDKVIRKKWQYSSMTAPGDPNLVAWPDLDDPSFVDCATIAYDVLHNAIANPVPGADSYFDISIQAPAWTKDARLVAQIGRIIFYDVDHDYEAPVTGH